MSLLSAISYQLSVALALQVTELLGRPESLGLISGQYPPLADAVIKPELHILIRDLVIHIHKNEPDMEKSILVFLPTYHDLEQLWFLLKSFTTAFKIHILHSSIDTEQALRAMEIWRSHRKVNPNYLYFGLLSGGVLCRRKQT